MITKKEYTIKLTSNEIQVIEKEMDRLASMAMTVEKEMIMEGQFRAGGNKLLSEEQNEKMKLAFWNTVGETMQYLEVLRTIRNKLEEVRQ